MDKTGTDDRAVNSDKIQVASDAYVLWDGFNPGGRTHFRYTIIDEDSYSPPEPIYCAGWFAGYTDPWTRGIDDEGITEIRAAFNAWAEVSGATFEEVKWNSNLPETAAEIVIGYDSYNNSDGARGQLGWTVVARTVTEPCGWDFQFEGDETIVYLDPADYRYDFGSSLNGSPTQAERNDFYNTVLHEIGHAIGIDHSDVRGALMSGPDDYGGGPPYTDYGTGRATLTADDIAAAQSLHGAPPNAAPPPEPTPPPTATPKPTWITDTPIPGVQPGKAPEIAMPEPNYTPRIKGTAGHDTRVGGNGNDDIDGAEGNDALLGGAGNDWIAGSSGDDRIWGQEGRDGLDGGRGNDLIYGQDGNDTIVGGQARDIILGGTGHDQIRGDSGNDGIWAEAGNDTIHGGTGQDFLAGGTGNDSVYGCGGADYLAGEAGNDTLDGGAGYDNLAGGAGDDTLLGGAEGDTFFGHTGADVFVVTGGVSWIMDFAPSEDILNVGDASLTRIEQNAEHAALHFDSGMTVWLANTDMSQQAGMISQSYELGLFG